MMIGSAGSPGGGGTLPSTPPVAIFSYSPSSPLVYFDTQFTDESTNVPTAWVWKVNGEVFSISQNPTYYFTTPGSYEIMLTVSNFFGEDSDTQILTVT